MIGWLKLHRKLLNWEWYNKSEYVHLFLHILIKANFEEKKWQGLEIKRGQLITSINHLSLETGISERSIRTILNKLKTTSELTIKTTNKYSLITIEKYSEYQCDEEKTTSKTTNNASPKRQTTDKQLTTTKEVKKEKKEKKVFGCEENIAVYNHYNFTLTQAEYKKLCQDFLKKDVDNIIEVFMNKSEEYLKKYASMYRTCRTWLNMNREKSTADKGDSEIKSFLEKKRRQVNGV